MEIKRVFSCLAVLFSLFVISTSDPDCVYTLYVRTGSIFGAGTNSNISATFYSAKGEGIRIKNLVAWGGVKPNGHDYFERGSIDVFTGPAPCLNGPICALNLTSDGTGTHAGWNCIYLEVTTAAPEKTCRHRRFSVNQWLATDTVPFSLFAFRNKCNSEEGSGISIDGSDSPTVYTL